MKSATLAIKSEEIRQRLFWALVLVISVMLLFYGYFTVSAIINVADRRRMETEVLDMRSDVVTLELSYIAKENGITLEKAHELGFVESKHLFASRDAGVTAVSLEDLSR
jgi:hypothetical protein